jgi:uncharacterized protein (DUF111 family)
MLLMATVDDVSAEAVPYIIERAMAAGADNVHVVSAITKKNRIEYIVLVDLKEEKLEAIYTLLAMELGTLGVKAIAYEHLMLPFRLEQKLVTVKAAGEALEGPVRVKYIEKEGRILSLKAEYEDLRALAIRLESSGLRVPISKLKALIEAEAYSKVLEKDEVSVEIREVKS